MTAGPWGTAAPCVASMHHTPSKYVHNTHAYSHRYSYSYSYSQNIVVLIQDCLSVCLPWTPRVNCYSSHCYLNMHVGMHALLSIHCLHSCPAGWLVKACRGAA